MCSTRAPLMDSPDLLCVCPLPLSPLCPLSVSLCLSLSLPISLSFSACRSFVFYSDSPNLCIFLTTQHSCPPPLTTRRLPFLPLHPLLLFPPLLSFNFSSS